MAEISIRKINEALAHDLAGFIESEDRKYRDFIDSVADRVKEGGCIRVILLAGPSGSGKTTTANLLCEAIKKRALESLVISLDDFYRDHADKDYPRTASGELDFESPEALHLSEISETIDKITGEKEFEIPHYNFKVSAREGSEKHPKISHGCIVIEGLHALNPKIFASVNRDRCIGVFISVSTNINDAERRILSGRKLRFVRRMVRDNIHRGADARRTLALWENVRLGEDKYLYPFRNNADIAYDTFHAYEPALMRKYAEQLISPSLAAENPYAKTVRDALLLADPIGESALSQSSLMREFIN